MIDFVKLGQRIDCNIYFAGVQIWAESEIYNEEQLKQHAVWRKDHPEHSNFLDILSDPIFDDPRVDLGNLSTYRNLHLTV